MNAVPYRALLISRLNDLRVADSLTVGFGSTLNWAPTVAHFCFTANDCRFEHFQIQKNSLPQKTVLIQTLTVRVGLQFQKHKVPRTFATLRRCDTSPPQNYPD